MIEFTNFKQMLAFYLYLLLFISCSEIDKAEEMELIIIRPDNSSNISFETFIDSLYLVPLETTEDNPITTIQKVASDLDHYYVLDYSWSPLQVYNKKGDFLRLIGRQGRGPGEYNQISDFYLEEGKIGFLYFRKVIQYSTSGEYSTSIHMEVLSNVIQPLGNKRYLHYISNGVVVDNTSDYFYVSDEKMKPGRSFFKKQKYYDRFAMEMNNFCTVGDTVRMLHDMGNIIYSYTDNPEKPLTPKYKLDFGKYWPEEDFLKATYNDHPLTFYNKYREKYISFPRFRESKGFVCLGYSLNKEDLSRHFVIFSKNEKVSYNFKVSDKDPSTYFFSRMMYNEGGWFIGEVSAIDLINVGKAYEKIENAPYWSKDLIKLSKKTDPSDNPIMVAIKIKEPKI